MNWDLVVHYAVPVVFDLIVIIYMQRYCNKKVEERVDNLAKTITALWKHIEELENKHHDESMEWKYKIETLLNQRKLVKIK